MLNNMEQIKEVAAYVRNNVENYEVRLQLALNCMDRDRCPLRMADDDLFAEIVDAIDDWCWENDVDCSEVDWDEAIEGEDGIIWEE